MAVKVRAHSSLQLLVNEKLFYFILEDRSIETKEKKIHHQNGKRKSDGL